MKYLKLFEGWSDEYLYDVTDDLNFTIEEDWRKVKGSYQGKFDAVKLSNSFADSVSKMSSEFKILKVQSLFNQMTGNAKFEIEVHRDNNEFIEINIGTEKVKWFPIKLRNAWSNFSKVPRVSKYIKIDGKLERGENRVLNIDFRNSSGSGWATLEDVKMQISLGSRSRGVSIDKENLSKLIKIISESPVIQGGYAFQPNRVDLEIAIETLNLALVNI